MTAELGTETLALSSEADLLFMEKLTPASLFATFCLSEQKLIRRPQEGLATIVTGRNHDPVIRDEHVAIPSLNTKVGREMFESLVEEARKLPGDQMIGRFGNYFQLCLPGAEMTAREVLHSSRYKTSTFLYDLLNRTILTNINEPTKTLEEGFKIIRWFRDNWKDPFTYTEKGTAAKIEEEIMYQANRLLETVEARKRQISDSIDTKGFMHLQIELLDANGEKVPTQISLAIGALEALVEEHHLSVAVWGPTFSGKSTMLAQLGSFLPEFLEELEVNDFIQVDIVDADYATPDVNRKIEKGDFSHLSSEETMEWTVEAAHQIVREYFQTTHGNVCLVNMPGGGSEPVLENPIMELLSQSLDCCILIIRDHDDDDWEGYRKVFADLIKRSGSRLVSLVRSREEGETTRKTKEIGESSITSITPRTEGPFFDRIGARIVELTGDNPNTDFYTNFVLLLLFGVLPKVALERLNAKESYYQEILKEYGRGVNATI